MSQDAPAPPVPPRLLAGASVAVAVPVLTVGGLLLALSEGAGPRVAGLALLAAGLVTVGAGLVAARRTVAPAAPLRVAVGALLLAAVVAGGLVATRDAVFLLDLLIVGGVPAAAALVLALLARAAQPPSAA